MGDMGIVVASMETRPKYLQFAGGTFSKTWICVRKLLGIIDFWTSQLKSFQIWYPQAKWLSPMDSGRSSTPGKRPPGMERSIPGPSHLRFYHYFLKQFPHQPTLIVKSANWLYRGRNQFCMEFNWALCHILFLKNEPVRVCMALCRPKHQKNIKN